SKFLVDLEATIDGLLANSSTSIFASLDGAPSCLSNLSKTWRQPVCAPLARSAGWSPTSASLRLCVFAGNDSAITQPRPGQSGTVPLGWESAYIAAEMSVAFVKMNGLGNDFVVVDARAHAVRIGPEAARRIGDRHRGVGFDQLLVIERA